MQHTDTQRQIQTCILWNTSLVDHLMQNIHTYAEIVHCSILCIWRCLLFVCVFFSRLGLFKRVWFSRLFSAEFQCSWPLHMEAYPQDVCTHHSWLSIHFTFSFFDCALYVICICYFDTEKPQGAHTHLKSTVCMSCGFNWPCRRWWMVYLWSPFPCSGSRTQRIIQSDGERGMGGSRDDRGKDRGKE